MQFYKINMIIKFNVRLSGGKMPEITKDEKEIIEQKLEYIGLDLENVPEF